MPVRRRHGRDHVVSAPQTKTQGRRAPLAPLRQRMPLSRSLGEATVVLALELLALEAAAGDRDARRAARKRLWRARQRVIALSDAETCQGVQAALVADGGRTLRYALDAAPDLREHLVLSAVEYCHIAREHGVTSAAGSCMLSTAAAWHALTRAQLGEAMRAAGAERAEAAKLARYADQCARLDLIGALELERRARDGQAQPDRVLDAASIDAAVRRAEAEWLAASPDEDDDESHGDDDEGEGPPEPASATADPPPGGSAERPAGGAGARGQRHQP